MTEALLALVPAYGASAVFLATYLGCLGLPVPGSLALLAAGSFAASGDLELAPALAAGFIGAVAGDQTGYWLGVAGGPRALDWAGRRGMAPAVARGRLLLARRGGLAVFVTRWLLAPLGPALNLLGGAGRMPWPRYTRWEMLGEAVWVGGYVGLGFAFSRSFVAVAELTGTLVWLLAAALVTAGLGWRISLVLRRRLPPQA